MKIIILFLVYASISLGVTKRNKQVLPVRTPATSPETSDTACPFNFLIDEEVRKTKDMLGTETLFRPCDCGGPGWEKIAFYDFSQQECPLDFTRLYGKFNNVSCQATKARYVGCTELIASSSLSIQVGRSYSSVCGRVRGHGYGLAFQNTIECDYYNTLGQAYVYGVSLTHSSYNRTTHIWTFAAALSDGNPHTDTTPYRCGCSDTSKNWTHATPEYVGDDYFCDSNGQYTEGGTWEGRNEDDDLWDGEGCGPSSSCCKWRDPPYFCKHLHYTASEDMEVGLFSHRTYGSINDFIYFSPTVSLIEIFVQ